MPHAADSVMRHGTTQFVLRDVFVGDGLNHIRPRDEHVTGVRHHESEIGNGGGVNRPARARPHDGGNLRYHAAGQGVTQENIRVTGQRNHALLNAGTPGIIQPDDGRTHLQREVHHLADLARVGL